MDKKKIDSIHPIKINENIWFYRNPKSFDFVVWTKRDENGKRQCVQFRLLHSKIKKFIK